MEKKGNIQTHFKMKNNAFLKKYFFELFSNFCIQVLNEFSKYPDQILSKLDETFPYLSIQRQYLNIYTGFATAAIISVTLLRSSIPLY